MNARILPPTNLTNQTTPRTWGELPAALRERLAREGIRSAADWRHLTPDERGRLWGVTVSMAKALDAIARAELDIPPVSDDIDLLERRRNRLAAKARRQRLKAGAQQ